MEGVQRAEVKESVGVVASWVRSAVGPGMDVMKHSKQTVVEAVSTLFGGNRKKPGT
jgi:hypothetical protein